MSKRALTIIVIISLAFNLAFIGTFGLIQFRRRSFLKHTFGPPPELREHFRNRKEHIAPLRYDFHQSKVDFIEELKKPDFNEELLNMMLENAIEKQTAMEIELGKSLIEIRKEMNFEEAQRFFSKFPRNNRKFTPNRPLDKKRK